MPVEISGRVVGLLYGDRIGTDALPMSYLERIKEATGANLTRIVVSGTPS